MVTHNIYYEQTFTVRHHTEKRDRFCFLYYMVYHVRRILTDKIFRIFFQVVFIKLVCILEYCKEGLFSEIYKFTYSLVWKCNNDHELR